LGEQQRLSAWAAGAVTQVDAVHPLALPSPKCAGEGAFPAFLLWISKSRRLCSNILSHCLQDESSNDIAWRPLGPESPKPNNAAKVFYFNAGPKSVSVSVQYIFDLAYPTFSAAGKLRSTKSIRCSRPSGQGFYSLIIVLHAS
jgi:hypothetical protein